jgi:uncharacterized protein with von Willebrand factor type A (vWA) domain
MFINFFFQLRESGIRTSLREYLLLLEALDQQVVRPDLEEFYYLSRALLVKHEGQLDRFDVLFGQYFQGKEGNGPEPMDDIPEEWIRAQLQRVLSPEEIEALESMGGLDALMQRFQELMQEQQDRHEGGNKWIGTGGSSPYGNDGFNPEGFRIGGKSRHRNAIKVWNKREFANLDDQMELNTRNIKLALKGLRVLTREGLPDELDLKGTIRKTSENAGMLDISMVPSRKNRVKVLLLLDAGGSMDDHVEMCSQLFSAARHEFKHLEHYYFHNCLYESVWKDNRRRYAERIPTWELLNTYNRDYKVIFVGDAAMSPIEILYQGGSVEHWNEEPGMEWLLRIKERFPSLVWINPNPEYHWNYYPSTEILRKFTDFRMYPMTLAGIQGAMRALRDPRRRYGDAGNAETHR